MHITRIPPSCNNGGMRTKEAMTSEEPHFLLMISILARHLVKCVAFEKVLLCSSAKEIQRCIAFSIDLLSLACY